MAAGLSPLAISVLFVPVLHDVENKSHNMRNSSCSVRRMCETRDVTKTNTMKAIYYKNWLGEWTKDTVKPSLKRLAWIKKHKALNGQATMQSA